MIVEQNGYGWSWLLTRTGSVFPTIITILLQAKMNLLTNWQVAAVIKIEY
jgi:hypothetical protein